MATVVVGVDAGKSPEQLAEEFLHNMPARFAACHGFGHNFPKPRGGMKGRKIKGLTLRKYSDCQELEFVCADCGMIRVKVSDPAAQFVWSPAKYRYYPPKGYGAPRGTGKFLRKAQYADESYRRYEEEQENPTGGEDMPRQLPPR